MRAVARTPEELETLLEDAFVLRSGQALTALFEDGAVLVTNGGAREARGGDEIARLACEMWEHGRTYLAGRTRVLQAREMGLIVAEAGISVVRRGGDRGWRYAIALLSDDDASTEEDE